MRRARELAGQNAHVSRFTAPPDKALWAFSLATTISLTGTFIQKVAVGWSVWDITHATSWLAAASLADLLPTLIVSVPAGAIVDRFRPATTFWLSQIASCAQAVALCVLALTNQLTVTSLFVCSIFIGTCNAFTVPARLAYMTLLTPRESYKKAVVLYSLGGNAAFFVGPLLAGVLISSLGVATAFGANALTYAPIIVVAAILPAGRLARPEGRQGDNVFRQIGDGFTYAMHHRAIKMMLVSFAALACTARGIMELAPSIAATALNGGVGTLSLLMASIAAGALAAGILMSRWQGWQEETMTSATLLGSAAALVGYGASGQIVFALPGATLLGFTLAMNNIFVTSGLQMHAAPEYRGRINSLYNMIFKGGPAIGSGVFGGLAQLTDIRASSVAAALILLLLLWRIWTGRQG